jgi:NTE family protein
MGGILNRILLILKVSRFYFAQLYTNNVILISNDLQFKFNKNYFISGNFSFANLSNDIKFEDAVKVNYSSLGLRLVTNLLSGRLKSTSATHLKTIKKVYSVLF